MKDIYHITPEEVAERALMPYRLVETEEKMYEEMGRIMADCIEKNHGKQTVIILPVGPIATTPTDLYRRTTRSASTASWIACSTVR